MPRMVKVDSTDWLQGYKIEVLKFRDVDTGEPFYFYTISLKGTPLITTYQPCVWAREAHSKAQLKVNELFKAAMMHQPRVSLAATMKAIAAERKLNLNGVNHE